MVEPTKGKRSSGRKLGLKSLFASSLDKNVWLLGILSLSADLASQMVYPLLPQFLIELGANGRIIGLIEGIAEAAASLLRAVFGKLSDKFQNRKSFVWIGYGLAAIAKPILFLASSAYHVLGVRFLDRLGKAVRSPARDALLSQSVEKEKRGFAFGVHRAMDRLGALGGPLLALLVLSLTNENLRQVFLWAAIPGLLGLLAIFFVKEKTFHSAQKETAKPFSFTQNKPFLLFLIANVFFTLGNSSNAFLILKAQEVGISLLMIPVLWMVYNAVCIISSPIFGKLSDKYGRKPIISISFLFYGLIYFLFAFANVEWQVWSLFAAYGIYYGLSKGIYKAYIADLVPGNNRATAYGIFTTGTGLALLPASLIMGFLWDLAGSQSAFLFGAGMAGVGFVIWLIGVRTSK